MKLIVYLYRVPRMVRVRRPSAQTVLVLDALSDDPATWRYGYELGQQVGLKAGSLYPILIRLRDRGLLEAIWEDQPSPGRPPRHLYRLTGEGVRWAAEVTAEPSASRTTSRPRLREA
ncbi:PadR family transcriptional regulator [Actinoplanes regularis]|nr:PadR family transcriptional regulator [Actinoplanes regularis]